MEDESPEFICRGHRVGGGAQVVKLVQETGLEVVERFDVLCRSPDLIPLFAEMFFIPQAIFVRIILKGGSGHSILEQMRVLQHIEEMLPSERPVNELKGSEHSPDEGLLGQGVGRREEIGYFSFIERLGNGGRVFADVPENYQEVAELEPFFPMEFLDLSGNVLRFPVGIGARQYFHRPSGGYLLVTLAKKSPVKMDQGSRETTVLVQQDFAFLAELFQFASGTLDEAEDVGTAVLIA